MLEKNLIVCGCVCFTDASWHVELHQAVWMQRAHRLLIVHSLQPFFGFGSWLHPSLRHHGNRLQLSNFCFARTLTKYLSTKYGFVQNWHIAGLRFFDTWCGALRRRAVPRGTAVQCNAHSTAFGVNEPLVCQNFKTTRCKLAAVYRKSLERVITKRYYQLSGQKSRLSRT